MGKGPGKSQTDTSLLQRSGAVGERTGPRGLTLNWFQLTPFSPSSPFHSGQHFNLAISLPPSSSLVYSPFSFPCLIFSFFLIAPLSHSYPLSYHLSVGACTDGLRPRAAGLNQLQFKMKAGGGGGAKPGGDISSLVSKSTALPQTSQLLSQYLSQYLFQSLSQSPLPIPHCLPPFLIPLPLSFPRHPPHRYVQEKT